MLQILLLCTNGQKSRKPGLEQPQVPFASLECCDSYLEILMCFPQGAFPARLKKVLIVGAPIWFRVPYSIISLLLKDKVRERVRQASFILFGGGQRLSSLLLKPASFLPSKKSCFFFYSAFCFCQCIHVYSLLYSFFVVSPHPILIFREWKGGREMERDTLIGCLAHAS